MNGAQSVENRTHLNAPFLLSLPPVLRSALSAQNAHRLTDAALASAQDAAEYLLAAEMQLGEFTVLMPDGHSRGKATMKRKEPPGGINKKQCKT